jgi:hypothetical protein
VSVKLLGELEEWDVGPDGAKLTEVPRFLPVTAKRWISEASFLL